MIPDHAEAAPGQVQSREGQDAAREEDPRLDPLPQVPLAAGGGDLCAKLSRLGS